MSDCERYGTRDLVYSNWHRIHSIKRFVGEAAARNLTMIDLDGLEYCHDCREVVGVIEIARDIGQDFKPAVVTRKLANRLGVPGLLVFYLPSKDRTVTDGNGGSLPDIDRFRARVIAPVRSPERMLPPAEYARWLERLHARCACHIAEDAA